MPGMQQVMSKLIAMTRVWRGLNAWEELEVRPMTDDEFLSGYVRGALIGWSIVAGIVVSAVLLACVWATGSTFGQRCEKSHPWGSDAWGACVDRLSKGGEVIAVK